MKKNITKEDILNQYSAKDIYIKFLNLSEFPRGNISSPFSKDSNPSFKIYNNGTFNCFSTGKNGDIFQFVAYLEQLDNKVNFQKILEIIANKMNIIGSVYNYNKVLDSSIKNENTESEFKIDEIKMIDFKENHLEFWRKLGVNKSILDKYLVKAVSDYSFYSSSKAKTLKFKINPNEIAFCYEVNGRYEIYIPEQKTKKKFFCNSLKTYDIFGLNQLPDQSENIIICAGKKDAVVANSRGFHAISFRSETQKPTKEMINVLQKRCQNLLICYDNDKGGKIGVEKILSEFPEIKQICLPSKYNDITDFFLENSSKDFQKILEQKLTEENDSTVSTESITTIFHVVEDYLLKYYELRYNKISLEIEITQKGKNNWEPCSENSLWLELQKKNIKIPLNSLVSILKSNIIPTYNPIKSYFDNLHEWDGQTDFIKTYCSYVELERNESKEQFEYHFKKWCVRAVKCALVDGYFNKQAFVLTDDGNGQNIGKSSWCRFLCPPALSNYIAEDMSDDKDARILLCKNFLINLDELAALSRKEINQLKSYFSKAYINERLPYDRKNSILPRVASFIGSTNMSTFLQDETGSVRWLCFVVEKINWKYREEFDINNLWSQAFALFKDSEFDENMTLEDIKINELRNDKFQIVSPEKDLIQKYFTTPSSTEKAEFLTPTEILHHINLYTSGIRLSVVGIGKALKAIGYKRVKNHQVYGYWIEKKLI